MVSEHGMKKELPGTPRPTSFLWLFQLDDSKSLHGKWLEITKHPSIYKWLALEFQVYTKKQTPNLRIRRSNWGMVNVKVSTWLPVGKRFFFPPDPIHMKCTSPTTLKDLEDKDIQSYWSFLIARVAGMAVLEEIWINKKRTMTEGSHIWMVLSESHVKNKHLVPSLHFGKSSSCTTGSQLQLLFWRHNNKNRFNQKRCGFVKLPLSSNWLWFLKARLQCQVVSPIMDLILWECHILKKINLKKNISCCICCALHLTYWSLFYICILKQ